MEGEELLGSLIEVGIGIAGFSAIVAVLARDLLSERLRQGFLQLWIQSTGVIVFSALPPLLAMAGDFDTYIAASYCYAGFLSLSIPFTWWRQRQFVSPWIGLLLLLPATALLNAIVLQEAYIYIGLILAGVVLAFTRFYQLMIGIWDEAQESAS